MIVGTDLGGRCRDMNNGFNVISPLLSRRLKRESGVRTAVPECEPGCTNGMVQRQTMRHGRARSECGFATTGKRWGWDASFSRKR